MPRILYPMLWSVLLCAVSLAAWADTCSYNWRCSGSQCAAVMGGWSGTQSQSGITFAQCEAARKATIGGGPPCTCTADGAATSSGTGGTKMAEGHNLQQNMVSAGANMMVANIQNSTTRAFMSGFTNSFLQSVFDSQAEAQRQRQIIEEQLLEQRRRQAEERRLAEQRRIDEMFARLNKELKLEGLPFNLSLKEMNSADPDTLQLKGMQSPGPGDLHLKMGDASASSYGLKGLPGIYVGGPEGGDSSGASGAASVGSGSGSEAGNPNLVSGPGTGSTGQGIAGLPGIYLDGVRPGQVPQLAQAAQNLNGPERELAEDTALHAAETNSAMAEPSQNVQVQAFQQADQDYQKAQKVENEARQQYDAAQERATGDQSAIQIARDHLATVQPTADQQAAMRHMMDVAKTDEQAAEAARKMFEGAQANLSLARTQASGALASLSLPPSTATHDSSVVDLSHATHSEPTLLRSPSSSPGSAPGTPVRMMAVAAASTPAVPIRTIPQLCAQLTGAQESLRRLMRTQEMNNQTRAEWEKTVDDASLDAWQRGFDMIREYGGDQVQEHIKDVITDSDKQIEQLYRDISVEKDPAKVGEMQKKWEQMERQKTRLEDALKRAGKDAKHLDEMASERDFFKWNEDNEGDLVGFLDGVRQVADMALGDEGVQHVLRISPEGAAYIKYATSIMDSAYDITGEALGWRRIEQLNQNSDQYLQAVNALQHRIHASVQQLDVYKAANPDRVRCTEP